jgi:hypothetical protein
MYPLYTFSLSIIALLDHPYCRLVKPPLLSPVLREMISIVLKHFRILFLPELESVTENTRGCIYRDDAFDRPIKKVHIRNDLLHTLVHQPEFINMHTCVIWPMRTSRCFSNGVFSGACCEPNPFGAATSAIFLVVLILLSARVLTKCVPF